jgi:aubergine-like protein
MELWPGYMTSIRQHERDILMCTEITHKVMRQDTVLNLLQEIKCESGVDWQDKFKQAVLGLVVLTDYNNRTYRVDDVDFRVTPATSFRLRSQEEITYASYYQTVSVLDVAYLVLENFYVYCVKVFSQWRRNSRNLYVKIKIALFFA